MEIPSLDEPLTVKEVANYLHFHEECLPANVKRSLFAPFHHLQTLRDLLRIWCVIPFGACCRPVAQFEPS